MSEPTSNNDSATGTFSFFETFQSSGDAIPSLDSISLSGELPQLPTAENTVAANTPVPEQVVTEDLEENLEETKPVAETGASPAEPTTNTPIERPMPPKVTPIEMDADSDFEIDPVLRPPARTSQQPLEEGFVPQTGVDDAKTDKNPVAAVETAVDEAAVVPEVPAPIAETESAVKVARATEPSEEKKPAPAIQPKPLTIEEIVAAAAARTQSSLAKSMETKPVQEVVSEAITKAEPVKPSVEIDAAVVDSAPVQAIPEAKQSVPAQPVVPNPVVETVQPRVSNEQAHAPSPTVTIAPVASDVNGEQETQATAADAPDGKLKFAELALSDSVKAAVQQSGYDTPTEIQAQIIPHMLEGRDVLAQSQTGTGKTAAFALPILSRIQTDKRETQVLVLAPTRELAMQVAESFETYGSEVRGFQVAAIYGGAGYENQIRQLKRASVVVGTPGRVIDHIRKGTLKLSTLDCLVLDEADEMLNMGFLEDVQFVLEHTPENRQVALFSATMPGPIRNIADRYLNNPVKITVKQKTMTAEAIRQRAAFVSPRDKMEVLARFLEVEETDGVIVFARTREATATVADELNARGLKAAALNGDMPQQVRERTVDQLKAGRLNIVVATDVAARGLDVPRIRHVFNYDVPMDNESYIHRIGRTGRAGKEGHAILFVTGGQKNRLRSIERATRQPIEIVEAPTAAQVNDVRKKTFLASIDQTIGKRDLSFFKQMLSDHAEATGVELIDIAAALADQLQQGRPFFAEDLPKTRRRENERGRDDRGGRDRFERGGERGADRGGRQDRRRSGGPPRGGMQRYRIEVGRADNVKPGNIVGAVANEGGIDGDQIGPISIYDDYSTVDLPDGMPQEVFQTLRKVRVAGKQLQLSRATPSDDQEQKRFGGKKFGDRNSGGSGRRFGGNRGGQGGSGGGFKGKSFAKKKFRRD